MQIGRKLKWHNKKIKYTFVVYTVPTNAKKYTFYYSANKKPYRARTLFGGYTFKAIFNSLRNNK
ncbi:hypothetical protein SAMN04487996_12010 [Dyadobacter soli]|uniref:Uncharacterized protein n=1 Tax=Dyadobacter soli TaxID=659014 RepID=A0A1G7V9S6_9BACT|nr:hypothetical protein SAMN04487996_12010 [Dyadobacter soli]